MGDCIKQARAFVQDCHNALDRADESCVLGMTEALADIQSGAKLNRARAIYRAAQDALHALEDESRLPLRLHALSNVVALYESGLVEMEEDDAEAEIDMAQSAKVISVDFSDTARQSRAVDAISSALPYAEAPQKQALEKLLAVSGHPIEKNQEETTVQTEAEIDITSPEETHIRDTPADARRNTPMIALESFIRDIVQTGLSIARQFNLTLSLSYDMGGVSLTEAKAAQIKIRAEACLAGLIRHLAATTTPDDLSHIDISASPSAMTFRSVAPPLSALGPESSDYADLITLDHDAKSDRLTLSLDFSKSPQMTQHKMPVEEGINSRLDALLETSLTEEPDPFQLGAVL